MLMLMRGEQHLAPPAVSQPFSSPEYQQRHAAYANKLYVSMKGVE